MSSALEALEWSRFLDFASHEAHTETGRERITSLKEPSQWASNIESARTLQIETQEMTSLLDREALWGPLYQLQNPANALDRLRHDSVLEIAELALIRNWLYALDSWTQIPREEVKGEKFKKALQALPDPLEPLRILDRVLTPENEMSERASPKLASLYSEMRSLKKEINSTLDQLIKTFSQKGVLQENFTDVRDGRYVIPVKISSQNDVDGIIYEASASRQTVFVEPKEVSPLNNRLRKLQNDLLQEIYLILTETSKKLKPFGGEIELSVEVISHWDASQARARLGRRYSGKPITITDDRSFDLKQTAHPLLWWSLEPAHIIRNQLEFGDPVRTLLLTGPNTGGKTVLLKTLGLAGLCARTGFTFPATDHPTVPFFDEFFADLGDPQSIEQHLSSFSGHIKRFKEILDRMTQNSLVLLDELNTATDPEEGAALGRAFLETIMERGAMIVATTHDPHLKALALSDQRILNASMEFDEQSRTPTFNVVLGVPGRSRALETAQRLGMPEDVLIKARSYLSQEHREFEDLLKKVESDTQEITRARREAVTLREEANKLKEEWLARTQTSVSEMLDRTRQKLRRILEQAQDEVRQSVRKLDEVRSRREVDITRTQLSQNINEAIRETDRALIEEAPEVASILGENQKSTPIEFTPTKEPIFEVGQAVRVPKWKNQGTILEMKNGKIKVALGTLQMTLSPSELQPLSEAAQAAAKKSATRIKDIDRPSSPPPQIDLRGVRFDEAMLQLEKYLDQAFRSGSPLEVTIIHGLGTGAIREGAKKLLSKLPYVKNYRDGGPGQGGSGATIVEFERS